MSGKAPHSILVYDFLSIEIKFSFLKLTMALNGTSMPNKLWNGMERGILDFHTNLLQDFSNFWVLMMSDFTKQKFFS